MPAVVFFLKNTSSILISTGCLNTKSYLLGFVFYSAVREMFGPQQVAAWLSTFFFFFSTLVSPLKCQRLCRRALEKTSTPLRLKQEFVFFLSYVGVSHSTVFSGGFFSSFFSHPPRHFSCFASLAVALSFSHLPNSPLNENLFPFQVGLLSLCSPFDFFEDFVAKSEATKKNKTSQIFKVFRTPLVANNRLPVRVAVPAFKATVRISYIAVPSFAPPPRVFRSLPDWPEPPRILNWCCGQQGRAD